MHGLKENVIVGRLIPAGTGRQVNDVKEVAADRDQALLDARSEEISAAAKEKSDLVAETVEATA